MPRRSQPEGSSLQTISPRALAADDLVRLVILALDPTPTGPVSTEVTPDCRRARAAESGPTGGDQEFRQQHLATCARCCSLAWGLQ